ANRERAGVVSGVPDTAVSRKRTVLRMEEKIRSQNSVQNVLRVGPIVSEHVGARHQVYRLCLGQRWIAEKQIAQVGREQIREIRNLRYGRVWHTLSAKDFELAGSGVPVHARLRIDQVVERHRVALRDQVIRVTANVRGLDKEAFGKLALVGEVPAIVDWRHQSRIKRRFDTTRVVGWLEVREV